MQNLTISCFLTFYLVFFRQYSNTYVKTFSMQLNRFSAVPILQTGISKNLVSAFCVMSSNILTRRTKSLSLFVSLLSSHIRLNGFVWHISITFFWSHLLEHLESFSKIHENVGLLNKSQIICTIIMDHSQTSDFLLGKFPAYFVFGWYVNCSPRLLLLIFAMTLTFRLKDTQ